MDAIRDREANDEWFAGEEPDAADHRFVSASTGERRHKLAEVLPTVRRDCESREHHMQPGVSFTTMGRGGIGEWIICKRCGGEATVEVNDRLEVEVSGSATLTGCVSSP